MMTHFVGLGEQGQTTIPLGFGWVLGVRVRFDPRSRLWLADVGDGFVFEIEATVTTLQIQNIYF